MEHDLTSNGSVRDALDRFAKLLLHWNRTVNLVSRADESYLWGRHINDSLRLAPLIPNDADRGIDLGSGAGFPGLILAIATKLPFDLIESDVRKAAFLSEARRVTRAPVRVLAGRIDTVMLPPAPLVTARALAPLSDLLRLAAPKLAPNGVALFPKGRESRGELTLARRQWHMTVETFPGTEPGAVVFKVSELHPATHRT